MALAPRYFKDIELLPENQKRIAKNIRMAYGRAMVNGPFSILVGTNLPNPTMIALTDRKKLRPMIAALSEDGNTVYASSEECAMRRVDMKGDIWAPTTGNPVIATLNEGLVWKGTEHVLDSKGFKEAD
jgi:glutamate synthase domain-containing protein 1